MNGLTYDRAWQFPVHIIITRPCTTPAVLNAEWGSESYSADFSLNRIFVKPVTKWKSLALAPAKKWQLSSTFPSLVRPRRLRHFCIKVNKLL